MFYKNGHVIMAGAGAFWNPLLNYLLLWCWETFALISSPVNWEERVSCCGRRWDDAH